MDGTIEADTEDEVVSGVEEAVVGLEVAVEEVGGSHVDTLPLGSHRLPETTDHSNHRKVDDTTSNHSIQFTHEYATLADMKQGVYGKTVPPVLAQDIDEKLV